MKFKIRRHHKHQDTEVVEIHDKKGRVIGTIEPNADGHSLVVVSDQLEKVGLENGSPAGVVVSFIDADAPKPTKT